MLSGKIAETKQGRAVNKLELTPVVFVPVRPSTRANRRRRLRGVYGGHAKPSMASRKKPWSWVRIQRIQRQITMVQGERARRNG